VLVDLELKDVPIGPQIGIEKVREKEISSRGTERRKDNLGGGSCVQRRGNIYGERAQRRAVAGGGRKSKNQPS